MVFLLRGLFFFLALATVEPFTTLLARKDRIWKGLETKIDTSTALFGTRMKFRPPSRVVDQTEFIQVEPDGQDAWKTLEVVDILERGGLGVLPTDSGYGFVCSLSSKNGLDRMLRIKGLHQCKKPMSLLCSNLSTIDEYCYGINKLVFKILKKNLPGAYTFILPAKSTLPKGIFYDSKGKKHSWKRQTLGVRIPQDPVLRYLQDELLGGMPLLVSSLPIDAEEEEQLLDCTVDPDASWCCDVDFVIDAGSRPYDGSTIFDLTAREPELVREGQGSLELAV